MLHSCYYANKSWKVYGFVQRFGFGVPLAFQACKENGNPEPEHVRALDLSLILYAEHEFNDITE